MSNEIITYEQLVDLVRNKKTDQAHTDRCLMPNGDTEDITVERFSFGIKAFSPTLDYIYCTHPQQYQLGETHPFLCQGLECKTCLIQKQILEGVVA